MYSDHNPISLTFDHKNREAPGRGFWKLNVSLLRDKAYFGIINETLDECQIKYADIQDKGLVWDVIKSELRGKTISYASHKAKVNR